MVEADEKNRFIGRVNDRIREYGLHPDSIEEVVVELPWAKEPYIVRNIDGSRNSAIIYAGAVRNNQIDIESAKRALEVYGNAYLEEARQNPGMHRSIDVMAEIVHGLHAVTARVVERQ